MGNRKAKRQTVWVDGSPLTGYERDRMRQVKHYGAWMLIEGPKANRKWTVFEKKSGKQLGWYYPASGQYGFAGNRTTGVEPNPTVVLRLFTGWEPKAVGERADRKGRA